MNGKGKEQMKKQYVAPMADKVNFDYEENVVASGSKECGCYWSGWNSNSYSYSHSWSFSINWGKIIKIVEKFFKWW